MKNYDIMTMVILMQNTADVFTKDIKILYCLLFIIIPHIHDLKTRESRAGSIHRKIKISCVIMLCSARKCF